MKLLFSLLITGLPLVSFAQMPKQNKNSPVFINNNPVVYLDSIITDLQYFHFNPENIVQTDVLNGKIYITSKNPKDYNFLSYTALKNKYIGNIDKPILLLVNGNFIKNPTKINIDSSYIYKVEVESGADFEELKNIYPTLAIVNIKLANSYNKNGERQIPLQGMPSKSFPE